MPVNPLLQVLSELIQQMLGPKRDPWEAAKLLAIVCGIALVIWMIIDP